MNVLRLRTHADERSTEGAPAAGSGGLARRRIMKLIGRGGIGLVAGLAGVFAASRPAAAAPHCCDLYYYPNNQCKGCGYNYTCPSGYYKRYWLCVSGVRVFGCGECQSRDDTCWRGGTYKCSKWWDDAYPNYPCA